MPDDVNIDDTMDEVLANIQEEEPAEAPEQVQPPEAPIAENVLDDEGKELKEDLKIEMVSPDGSPIELEEPGETIDPGLVNPPSGWRANAKAKWDSIDPEIRAEIKKREQDAMNGANALKDRASQYDEIEQVMQPYQAIIQAEGGTPATVVNEMLRSAYILRQGDMSQKVEMVGRLAHQYGFLNELRTMLVQGVMPQQPAGLTPQQVEQMVEQRLQERESNNATSTNQQAIVDFQSATNEDGSLKYPYFDNVRHLMANVFETSAGDMTLEEAYERAIWADPETRAVLQQQSAAEDQAKARVEKAKKADTVNLRKRASHDSQQPKPTGSIDDTLNETMEEIRRRSA